jgi:hypothetical protein
MYKNRFRGICKLRQILENTVTLQKNKNKTCTFFSKCETSRIRSPGSGFLDPEPWIRFPGSRALDPDSINMDSELTILTVITYGNNFSAILPVQHA